MREDVPNPTLSRKRRKIRYLSGQVSLRVEFTRSSVQETPTRNFGPVPWRRIWNRFSNDPLRILEASRSPNRSARRSRTLVTTFYTYLQPTRARHDSILSRVGASGKPGAVQEATMLRSGEPTKQPNTGVIVESSRRSTPRAVA